LSGKPAKLPELAEKGGLTSRKVMEEADDGYEPVVKFSTLV